MRWLRFRKLVYVAFLLWLWVALGLWTAISQFGSVDHAQPAEAIILLGAGLWPGNIPPPAMIGRVEHGAALWKQGLAPTIICSGGIASPRYTRTEASVCAELLVGLGVPAEAIIQEDKSRSTEENALLSVAVMQARGWTTAIVVSDQYHLFRAAHIFSHYPLTVYSSGATRQLDGYETTLSTVREIIALHWLWVKEALNLPYTYVGGL